MKQKVMHNSPVANRALAGKKSIEERAISLAQYIIESKDTVRGAAKKFGISKSTVHTDVTLKNGLKLGQVVPESIEIKGIFLSAKNVKNK